METWAYVTEKILKIEIILFFYSFKYYLRAINSG